MFSWMMTTTTRMKNNAVGKCHLFLAINIFAFSGPLDLGFFSLSLHFPNAFCKKTIEIELFGYALLWVLFVFCWYFDDPPHPPTTSANIFIKPLNVEYQFEWTMPDSDISIVRCWPFDRHSIFRAGPILLCVIIWPSFMRIEYPAHLLTTPKRHDCNKIE